MAEFTGIPRAANKQLLECLAAKCAFEEGNLRAKNRSHADIRKPGSRHFPTIWDGHMPPEDYKDFGTTLRQYDVEITPTGAQVITDRAELPPLFQWPATSELKFRKELVKALWLSQGHVDRKMAERFIPAELRGADVNSRAHEFAKDLQRVGYYLRHALTTKFMFPVLLEWSQDPKFAQLGRKVSKRDRRQYFWRSKVQKDPSIVMDWLRPCGASVNLAYIYRTANIVDEEQRMIQHRMQCFFLGLFLWVADIVYIMCIDHNPLDPAQGFKQFNNLVTMDMRDMYNMPNLIPYKVPLAKWPSFARIEKTRATKQPAIAISGRDETSISPAFLDLDAPGPEFSEDEDAHGKGSDEFKTPGKNPMLP